MRREDWPQRLDRVINEARTRRFGYGSFDCAILAAAAVDAMTGSNLEQRVASLYADGRSAVSYLRQFSGFCDAVSWELERLPVAVRGARRGDIVLYVQIDKHGSLGVCLGELCAIPAKPQGLDFRPVVEGRCAWRID